MFFFLLRFLLNEQSYLNKLERHEQMPYNIKSSSIILKCVMSLCLAVPIQCCQGSGLTFILVVGARSEGESGDQEGGSHKVGKCALLSHVPWLWP